MYSGIKVDKITKLAMTLQYGDGEITYPAFGMNAQGLQRIFFLSYEEASLLKIKLHAIRKSILKNLFLSLWSK